MKRIISVSTAPYDGYELAAALDSIAGFGAKHVEPAFIEGYMEPFTEDAFTETRASEYCRWLKESGLACSAFSAHMDLGSDGATQIFTRRMDFAAALGAKVINTNAAARRHLPAFFRNLGILARHAEGLGLVIALENPGNGEDNLFNTAQEGVDLVAEIGSPYIRLNYDAGNTVSHRPGQIDPAQDTLTALSACAHLHLKDVKSKPDGYFFTPLGQGEVDYRTILQAAKQYPALDLGIELPLRFHRDRFAQPVRRASRVDLTEIENALRQSLTFLNEQLAENAQGLELI
jgi:sugar phosphate isomerase/epimerase